MTLIIQFRTTCSIIQDQNILQKLTSPENSFPTHKFNPVSKRKNTSSSHHNKISNQVLDRSSLLSTLLISPI